MIAPRARRDWLQYLVIVAAGVMAACSAYTSCGSPLDASRLATIESLVDRGTLAIDGSMFNWTVDKVFIHGHYYSDKPPVPCLFLAAWYGLLQAVSGLQAVQNGGAFCYLMVLGSSGPAYVVAAWASYRMARTLGLGPFSGLGLACCLCLGTMVTAYIRAVNSHLLLLGVAVPMIWLLECLRQHGRATPAGQVVLLGLLGGLGYAIEQPTGGLLLAGAGLLVLFRRGGTGLLWLILAALPLIALHHGTCYAISGNWKPIGTVPEYFDYPGSEFNASNITGRWNHPSLGACTGYAFRLLFGVRGFVTSNLPVQMALLAFPVVLWRGRAWRPELFVLGGWCVGTWLVYAALSTNFSGHCQSVRWFLPLLAAGNYVLAVLLRTTPDCRPAFWALTLGACVIGGVMWSLGPWFYYPTPGINLIMALTWCAVATALFCGLVPASR